MKTYKIRINPLPLQDVALVSSNDDAKKLVLKHTVQIDKDGNLKKLSIDQFSGKHFLLNENGFPMNDIDAFEHSQSDSLARTVLQRIKVSHPESIDQSLTPDEMFASVVPSSWSSPAEFVRAQQTFAKVVYQRTEQLRQAAALKAAQKAVSSKSKKVDQSVKVEPE